MTGLHSLYSGVFSNRLKSAREPLGRAVDMGLFEFGLAVGNIVLGFTTHDPFYFDVGIAFAGIGALWTGRHYLRQRRALRQDNDNRDDIPGG